MFRTDKPAAREIMAGHGPAPGTSAGADEEPGRLVTEPLALYVHWPFCLAKCPYCDFNRK